VETGWQLVDNLTGGNWFYERVGYDRRAIGFLPDGRIGTGAAAQERNWQLIWNAGFIFLEIRSDHRLTCRLLLEPDGNFRGSWEHCEKMPVVVSRVTE
jgi:hypothetical protein